MNKILNKHFLLFIFCFINVVPSSATMFRFCCYYNGFWGNWTEYWTECWGHYGGFMLYGSGEHKSNYYFAFAIDGYRTPSQKEIKEHRKNNTWWTYTGTVEYYISDVYPTLKSCLMELGRPLKQKDTEDYFYQYEKLPLARATNMRKHGELVGFTRVKSKATIKIAPYKKHPEVYNIWVDDVAFAISLNGNFFHQK
ncbi:MAG: hypothetical protein J1E37_07805 [Prevotella sp.]|nr:hypothetical protein [Prevotella sp.]